MFLMVKARLLKVYKRLTSRKRYIFLIVLSVILIIFFTPVVKKLLILIVLGLAATYSTMYKRIFQAPPAFELITLTTVAVAIFFNPVTAVFYTITISLTSEIASQALDPFSFTYIIPRIIVVFVSRAIYGGSYAVSTGPVHSIALLGLLMSLLYNALQQPVYTYLTDIEKRIKSLYFSSLNIPINFLVFKFLGEPLFTLLARLMG